MAKKVIFLGLAGEARTFDAVAAQDAGFEVWTINDWYVKFPAIRPDRVFQVHQNYAEQKLPGRYLFDVIEVYNSYGCEIVTTFRDDRLKRNKVFDVSEVFDTRFNPFFSSTLSVMFCLAWIEKFEQIDLVGVVLGQHTEWEQEVPGVLGAIIESKRRGITVNAPYFDGWMSSCAEITHLQNDGSDEESYVWTSQRNGGQK